MGMDAERGGAQLVYLTYLSRSGSTYLARLLDELEGVQVSLEAPLGFRPFPGRELSCTGAEQIERYVGALYQEPKFQSWGVDREALTAALARHPATLHFPDLLRAILAEAFHGANPAVQVYKNGECIFDLERLHRRDPRARFLFIARDLRGIYNSQRHTPASRTGRFFATNPVKTAVSYNEVFRLLQAHAGSPFLHVVRYEDLIESPEAVLAGICSFLGIACVRQGASGAYAARIEREQQKLHPHVGGPPRPERLQAWREELTSGERRLLEALAGPALQGLGYALESGGPTSWADRLYGLWCCVRFTLDPRGKASWLVRRIAGVGRHRGVRARAGGDDDGPK